MRKPQFDPGLTNQYTGVIRRSINPDGSFNVIRRGSRVRDTGVYLLLINMTWPRFFAVIAAGYVLVNLFFATLYYLNGVENLAVGETGLRGYLSAFFFSVHTLTTIGYGNMAPKGVAANLLSAIEALIGLLTIALGTGMFYGRFSRPNARLVFSNRMLVSPYQQEGAGLMVRVANRRPNVLMDIQATLLLMTVEEGKRRYQQLTLERERINFLPLTWTVVHPIDDTSPLRGKTAADLAALQAEFLILIAGFDDTFSQSVHARFSYPHHELVWGARFQPAFEVSPDGMMVLDVERVHDYQASLRAS